MLDLTKKVFRIALLAVLCLGLALPACSAERQRLHELVSAQAAETKADGEDVIRIEIGIKRDSPVYEASTRSYQPNALFLDLEDTIPGRLRHEMEIGAGVRLSAKEIRLGHTRLQLTLPEGIHVSDYSVDVLPAERKKRLPLRLAIEIRKSPRATQESRSVMGIRGRHIVLDPGHGGSDSGAVGPSGYMEKTATLAVAKKTRDILQASGATVLMTRETDRDVYGPNASASQELQARVNVSLRDPAVDIFVSIHCNAFASPTANGTETYYCPGSRKGYELAKLLDEELIRAGGLSNRGVKEANFYVLRHSPMPASLVELAFVTNYREERLLADPSFQDRMAQAIARGISRYFGS